MTILLLIVFLSNSLLAVICYGQGRQFFGMLHSFSAVLALWTILGLQ
jgi:hypothetical protein